MYRVELYARVRRACHVEGMSTREGAVTVTSWCQLRVASSFLL